MANTFSSENPTSTASWRVKRCKASLPSLGISLIDSFSAGLSWPPQYNHFTLDVFTTLEMPRARLEWISIH